MAKAMYILDGARIKSAAGFFREFGRVVIPGENWGRNFDAFNDVLHGGFGTPDEGFSLLIRNSGRMREQLGYPATIRRLRILSFRHLTKARWEQYRTTRESLRAAKRGEGPTIFDILIEIIKDHDDIELLLE